jgi:hypothetical protein
MNIAIRSALAIVLLGAAAAPALAQSATPVSQAPVVTASMPADVNPNVPGATGDTIVRGDHSTVAGDKNATYWLKAGGGMAGDSNG